MAKLTRNIAGRISESKMIKAFREEMDAYLILFILLSRMRLRRICTRPSPQQ